MKDINYREEDWQEAKSALAPFAAANWFGGLFNNLEDVSKNMEVAEEDILDLDSDRAISFQHKNYQDKYGEIEDDLKVLHKFSSHAGERIETLIDEPFYKKLDAFVDGMQDLSITTYSTTNRIGAKSTQTYTTSDGTSQVIESVKENATIEDLMNGDNFYANQMNLQYEAWKRANPDQDVSEADFKMGMLHTRAFDYKSIKDKQEEKEFWVNIVATVVMVGVSIVCPPAGLALGIGYGALEASSAITGKDWISGRELSNQERLLRGGFALLDIIPGVKAFSSGAKIASTGSKMLRVGDDLLGGGKLAIKNAGKEFQGTIDNGIQAGKQVLDVRIANVKKVTDDAMQAAKEKLTRDLNDIGTAAKTIQSKAKETFQMPPRERLAFAGVGDDIAGQTATGTISAAQKKLRDMMSKMDDLNIKGSGNDDIIKKASGTSRSQTMEEFLKEMEELPRARLSKKVEDGLVSLPNGKRLDPSVYMSKEEIETHLSLFDDGVVRVQSKKDFDFAIKNYGPDIGDPKTGTYVMPKSVADKAIKVADGNPRILEELLGLKPMSLGENPVLLDIKKTTNMRVPSGNESGAWQGLWEPGGFTNGGIPEAVVDTIKSNEYIVKNVF